MGRQVSRFCIVVVAAALSACDEAAPTTSTLTITSVAFTITGFQIFRVPCEVVRIRAMLHTRIGGQLFPASAAQTIAETTVPIVLRIAAMPQRAGSDTYIRPRRERMAAIS